MVYCMSDIHGEYERYIKMLEQINFAEEDSMYVIGDVIDRYPQGIDILMDIMSRSNIHMILGNHEQMLLDAFAERSVPNSRLLWKQNGGEGTYMDMLFHRSEEECRKIIAYLCSLPDYMNIEVNGRKYHLVHGFPSDDHGIRLWGRPNNDTMIQMDGVTVIVGHTPTIFLNGESSEEKEPFRIWHGTGIICIDGGCGHRMDERKLACLRLDDMKEFYV